MGSERPADTTTRLRPPPPPPPARAPAGSPAGRDAVGEAGAVEPRRHRLGLARNWSSTHSCTPRSKLRRPHLRRVVTREQSGALGGASIAGRGGAGAVARTAAKRASWQRNGARTVVRRRGRCVTEIPPGPRPSRSHEGESNSPSRSRRQIALRRSPSAAPGQVVSSTHRTWKTRVAVCRARAEPIRPGARTAAARGRRRRAQLAHPPELAEARVAAEIGAQTCVGKESRFTPFELFRPRLAIGGRPQVVLPGGPQQQVLKKGTVMNRARSGSRRAWRPRVIAADS